MTVLWKVARQWNTFKARGLQPPGFETHGCSLVDPSRPSAATKSGSSDSTVYRLEYSGYLAPTMGKPEMMDNGRVRSARPASTGTLTSLRPVESDEPQTAQLDNLYAGEQEIRG
jgi:hypothetical protein